MLLVLGLDTGADLAGRVVEGGCTCSQLILSQKSDGLQRFRFQNAHSMMVLYSMVNLGKDSNSKHIAFQAFCIHLLLLN